MIKMIIIIIIINCIWLHYYTLTVSKSGEQVCRIQLRFLGGDCLFWVLPKGSAVKNPPAVQETPETWVRFLAQEGPLEKEMATLSSILAWGIPWTEEPGRLQSVGSQRAGHNWATEHSACCDQYMKPNEQMHIKIVKHAGASLVSLMITSSWGCFLLVLSVFMIPSYCPLVLLQRLSVLFFSFLCGEFPLSPKAEFQKLVQHCNRWIGNSCKATSDCCFGIGTTACPSHVYA